MRKVEYKMKRAENMEDMLKVFKPFPLGEKNYNEFYVDTSEARGDNAAFKIIYRLKAANSVPIKLLFMGHSGSGKSTELFKVEKELSDAYQVVRFSIRDEVDIMDLTYADMIFTIMHNVIETLHNEKIRISDDKFDKIFSYWNDERVCEILDVSQVSIEAELEAKASFVNTITARIKGLFQIGSESKNIIRKKIEPNLRQLIQYTNEIIEEADKKLEKKGKRLLLIIEDLDKLDIGAAEELFIKHRKVITSLQIHTIYTFPIFLFYSTQFNAIKDDFDAYVLLSMIKTKGRDGRKYEKGVETIRQIIGKRANLNLIADNALELAIMKSGGALRDIFEMLENAVLEAKTENINAQRIEMVHIEKAYNNLKSSYERVLSKGHLALLKEIYKDPSKKPIEDEEKLMELLKSMAVIEYNGERWCGLHPAIEDFLREKGELNAGITGYDQ